MSALVNPLPSGLLGMLPGYRAFAGPGPDDGVAGWQRSAMECFWAHDCIIYLVWNLSGDEVADIYRPTGEHERLRTVHWRSEATSCPTAGGAS